MSHFGARSGHAVADVQAGRIPDGREKPVTVERLRAFMRRRFARIAFPGKHRSE